MRKRRPNARQISVAALRHPCHSARLLRIRRHFFAIRPKSARASENLDDLLSKLRNDEGTVWLGEVS
jgi:hypothetical protein